MTASNASSGVLRVLTAWVDAARRHAPWVIGGALALSAASLLYTVGNLKVDTSTGDMLSAELPFRKAYIAYQAAFPDFSDSLVIVLDGDNTDIAEDAARRLALALRERPQQFQDVLYPAGDPYFAKNGLLFLDIDELDALGTRLAEAQPLLATLNHDPSLRGLFDVLGRAVEALGDGEEVPDALARSMDAISEVVEARAAGRRAVLSWRELLHRESNASEDRRQIVVVQPRDDPGTYDSPEALATTRALARSLDIDPAHGVRVRLTGPVALDTEELQSVSRGAGLSGIVSLVLVSALLVVGLRSVRLSVAVVLTLLMGLVWTAGFAALAIGHLNLISVSFAILFIGLGVDFGIHFSLRFQEAMARSTDSAEALREASRSVGGALTLSGVCAALAFFSFLPTAYRGVAELGLIAGTGMFIALFANFTVLPALLSVSRFRRSRETFRSGATPAATRWIDAHGRTVCLAALVLGLGAAALVPRARFDFNPINLKDLGTESVQTIRELIDDPRTAPFQISALAPDLASADRLAERANGLDVVDHTLTLSSFVPGDQEEKLDLIDAISLSLGTTFDVAVPVAAPQAGERIAALGKLQARIARVLQTPRAGPVFHAIGRLGAALERFAAPDSADTQHLAGLEAALIGTLPLQLERLALALDADFVTLEDVPESIRKRHITADGRARLSVYPMGDLTDNDTLRRFVTAVRAVVPGATDNPVILLEAGDAVILAFEQASSIALAVIGVLLIVILRHLWDSMLVLAPLLLAALLTVAATVTLGLPFNFANIIVMPLLLGLGVASGIHLVMRARQPGQGPLFQSSTPRAVVFSALTTIGSFGSLSLSHHRGTASMGYLLTLAIVFTLLSALVVLPALIAWRARLREGSTSRGGMDGSL